MPHSGSPESHDNTSEHANHSDSGGAIGDTLPGESGHPPAPPEHNGANNHSEQSPRWWDRGAFVLQLLIFIVGCYVAWVYSGQLDQMRESNKINRDALQSVQRAFIVFAGPTNGARLVDNSGGWTGQEIAVNWINGGNTAARGMVIQTNAAPFFPDIPEGYAFPLALPKAKAVLGPKAGYGTNDVIFKDVIADYWRSKKRIFIWGNAAYKDVFAGSPDRLTEFCVELTHLTVNMLPPPGNGKILPTIPTMPPTPQAIDVDRPEAILTGFQWQQCPQHNCYDEDCKDYAARVKEMREP